MLIETRLVCWVFSKLLVKTPVKAFSNVNTELFAKIVNNFQGFKYVSGQNDVVDFFHMCLFLLTLCISCH